MFRSKKVVTILFLCFVTTLLFIKPVHALPTLKQLTGQDWNADDQMQFSLDKLFTGWKCKFVLTSGCEVQDQQGNVFAYTGTPTSGAIGAASSLMAGLYNSPPTSSVYYVASIGQNIGLVPKSAYAAVGGSGNQIIAPVYQLWDEAKNLAYVAYIIVFIVVGFMIMFRQKMNPQTVVTIQTALPGLVVGIILVTISYFIAAFIVDLAFLGIQIVTQLIINSGMHSIIGGASQLQDLANNSNILNMFSSLGINNGDATSAVQQGITSQIYTTLGAANAHVITAIIGAIAGGIVGFGPGALVGGLIGGGTGPNIIIPDLVLVILLFALFIQLARVAFSLIGSYIQILILTIAGPFFILWGSLPGKSGTIQTWIRGLLANVLVFPAVFGAILFASVMLGDSTAVNQGNTATLPLFGGLSSEFMKVLIAYGILLGLPGIPGMVQKALKYQGPQAITSAALGGALAGFGVGRMAAQPIGIGAARAVGPVTTGASTLVNTSFPGVAAGINRVANHPLGKLFGVEAGYNRFKERSAKYGENPLFGKKH